MTKISESFSEEKIDEFVDKLLKNQSINMSLMPDYIEKQLYKNVFSIKIREFVFYGCKQKNNNNIFLELDLLGASKNY